MVSKKLKKSNSLLEHAVTKALKKKKKATVENLSIVAGKSKTTCRSVLKRLQKKGFAKYEAPYFIWKNGK